MSAEVQLSRPVLELLTRWATCFEGPCTHFDQQQYGSPGDVRSGCLDCTSAFDGWDREGTCDVCGRMCRPPGAWSLPPADTGGVQLLLRVCDACPIHQVDLDRDSQEDPMPVPVYTRSSCNHCADEFCRQVIRNRGAQPYFADMHPGCRRGLLADLANYGRRSEGQRLGLRVAVVRTLRELRGAA